MNKCAIFSNEHVTCFSLVLVSVLSIQVQTVTNSYRSVVFKDTPKNQTVKPENDMDPEELELEKKCPPLNVIAKSIYSSTLISNTQGFIKSFCYIIAEMIVYPQNIPIDHKKMLLNVSRKDWSGNYGIQNLFDSQSENAFCSEEDSGNCVDLLVDLGEEYTISTFRCWTPRWSFYSCPVTHAYLWVFGAQTTKTAQKIQSESKVDSVADANNDKNITNDTNGTNKNRHDKSGNKIMAGIKNLLKKGKKDNANIKYIKKLCSEKLYSNVKFEKILELTSEMVVLDEETRERKRDEMIPVVFIKLSQTEERSKCQVPSYVKGRYIMFKLVSDPKLSRESSNVDIQYVAIDGYKMN